MKYFLLSMLCLFPLIAIAEETTTSNAILTSIYMQKDKNGNMTYSDTSEKNATTVPLPNTHNSISLPESKSASPTHAPISNYPLQKTDNNPTLGQKPYTRFIMTEPSNEATYQNQREIPVKIDIEPALQQGDKIQLYWDGNPVGDATSNLGQLVIHQPTRGTHQVSATILDKEGHVLSKIDAVTIYVHYSAIPTGSGAVPGNATTAP